MNSVIDTLSRWDAPGGSGSVYLGVSTIHELRSKAIDAFLSLPKRGVEIGGLLLGREQGGQLFIQASEEVACEHRYGPSYTLSDEDRAHLAAKLVLMQRDPSLRVIGFYRSYTGRQPELETAELALLREHFSQGPFVFLLLQPLNAQKCNADFRFCRDGELLADPPSTPVSFDPEDLDTPAEIAFVEAEPASEQVVAAASGAFPVTDSVPADPEPPPVVVPEEPVAAPQNRDEKVTEQVTWFSAPQTVVDDPAPKSSAPEPLVEEPPLLSQAPVEAPKLPPSYRSLAAAPVVPEPVFFERPARKRWWLPVLICLVSGIVGAVVYELWTLASQPRWAELYLDAKPSADARSLLVTWDAAAVKSSGATHALLGITEGSGHHDVPLSQAQVELGRYVYTPTRSDLELRLVLYGKGRALSGAALRIAPVAAPGPTVASAPPRLAAGTTSEPPATEATGATRRAIHEAQPRVPAGIRARLFERVEIPVNVKIDARGRVVSAYAPSAGDGLHRYLATEATAAARQWRFAPARNGGVTEKTITFTFAP